MEILKLPRDATVEDLYELDEKAEIVNGQIVLMGGTGFKPNRAAGRIYRSLDDHELERGGGYALTDGAVFVVNLPHRQSFSPDAAWYTGAPTEGRFMQGPPALAVEVRSQGDYGLRAEREMLAKRADYFATGTAVVWDVDVLREQVVRVYRSTEPDTPVIYHRGEVAEAEPAVPRWRFEVDRLFA
ncbi:MAG: Uma2 family endonuclease [Gemmatimonadota bacterium]|nr:Uma2 family endonuclease [Gemmatimonadota bacterium]